MTWDGWLTFAALVVCAIVGAAMERSAYRRGRIQGWTEAKATLDAAATAYAKGHRDGQRGS